MPEVRRRGHPSREFRMMRAGDAANPMAQDAVGISLMLRPGRDGRAPAVAFAQAREIGHPHRVRRTEATVRVPRVERTA